MMNDIRVARLFPFSVHPDVLRVRWEIYANLERWDGALEIAGAIIKLDPGQADCWLYKASSLHSLNRNQDAHQTLLDALKRFPKDSAVLYDLACLCCMMERLKEAKGWLEKAIEAGGDKIKKRALDDPDFEMFWKKIGEL